MEFKNRQVKPVAFEIRIIQANSAKHLASQLLSRS